MTSLLSCVVASVALGGNPGLQGLPFGIPPAADDAVIASVAPPQCLFYVNWAGTASPNPASKCETEKLLAEPEVQALIGGVNTAIAAYLRRADEDAKKADDAAAATQNLPAIPSPPSGAPAPAALPVQTASDWIAMPRPIASPQAPPPASAAVYDPPVVVTPLKPAFISAATCGDLLGVLLSHPTAIFVSDVKYAPRGANAAADESPELQGGMVVKLGPEAGRVIARFINGYTKAKHAGKDNPFELVRIDGKNWYRTKPTQLGDKNVVTFGFHDDYFVAGMGKDSVKGILARWNRPAPSWLTKAMQQTVVPRRTGIVYLNVKMLREKLLPMADSKKDAVAILKLLGLDNADTLISTTGLEEQGMVNRVLLAIDGKPRGLLEMLGDRPLRAEDVGPIPSDALLAATARVDLDRIVKLCIDVGKRSGMTSGADAEKSYEEFEQQYGIDLHRVSNSVGDTWCIYNAPAEGEFPVFGWTAVARIRDRATLANCLERLCAPPATDESKKQGNKSDTSAADAPGLAVWTDVRKCRFAGHDIYYQSGQPIAPAVCLTEHELVMTFNMPAMKAYLARREHRSLAALPRVKSVFDGANRPTALGYCDTPRLFESLYPLLSLYGSMGAAAAQKMGVDLDPTFWPSATAIRPHLTSDITTFQRTPHGIELTCRYCLPTGGMNGPLWMVALAGGGQTLAFLDCMPKPIAAPKTESERTPPSPESSPKAPGEYSAPLSCPDPAPSRAPTIPPAPDKAAGNAPAWNPYASPTPRPAAPGYGGYSAVPATAVGDQVLPSPESLQDDVQYFPPASFPLGKDAKTQKQSGAQESVRREAARSAPR